MLSGEVWKYGKEDVDTKRGEFDGVVGKEGVGRLNLRGETRTFWVSGGHQQMTTNGVAGRLPISKGRMIFRSGGRGA